PALAAIADVGDALPLVRVTAHLLVETPQGVEVWPARIDPAEAYVVPLGAGMEQAERREEPRDRRHDRGAHAELGGERGGVHRARAAVRDQDEVDGVAPLFGR